MLPYFDEQYLYYIFSKTCFTLKVRELFLLCYVSDGQITMLIVLLFVKDNTGIKLYSGLKCKHYE